MSEELKPRKVESARTPESSEELGPMEAFVALAKELNESQENFPFPGIELVEYEKMKATEMEFPEYTTPIDELLERFRSDGMKVILGGYVAESGNVYVVPGGISDAPNDDRYISPKFLQINDTMGEKIKQLILMDRSGLKHRPD